MYRLFLIMIALATSAFAIPVAAQSSDRSLVGSWALVSDGTVMFRFDLEYAGNGEWDAVWLRPDSFGSNGEVFVQVRGPAERVEASGGLDFAGTVELTFPDPRPGAVPDIFRFRQLDARKAEMIYVGTGLDPYVLVRASAADDPGPWDYGKTYHRPGPDGGAIARNDVPAPAESAIETSIPDAVQEEPESRIGADFLDGL